MKRLVTTFATAAVLAVTATAASAAPAPANPIAPRIDGGSAPKAAPEKQYCLRDTTTGSRVPRTVCRTRKAWMAEGFDPVAKN